MTRVSAPNTSDDDFEIVPGAEAVPGLIPDAGPSLPPTPSPMPREHLFDAPAAASTPSQRRQRDDVQGLAQAMSGIPLDDSIATPGASTTPIPGAGPSQPGNSTDGWKEASLKYYNKAKSHIGWGSKDALIAVMGMTGSGKTTFISKVTGRKDLQIGHDLTSCTRDIQVIATKIGDRTVRFVDTPGFSDTNLSDAEVLQMIADYLATAYKNDMKLTGIIYLHPISDTRVTHHTTKNLEMFKKLTGDDNLKNVLLTTSMWDKVTPEEGDRRELELQNKFWKLLIAFGAKSARYTGTPESARQLAATLLANTPFYLQLQEEMGEHNKPLRETAAGQELMLEITRMKEEHQRQIADLKETMLRTSAEENKTAVEVLKEEYQARLDEMQKTLRDERSLNEQAVKALTQRIDDLESRHSCSMM